MQAYRLIMFFFPYIKTRHYLDFYIYFGTLCTCRRNIYRTIEAMLSVADVARPRHRTAPPVNTASAV